MSKNNLNDFSRGSQNHNHLAEWDPDILYFENEDKEILDPEDF